MSDKYKPADNSDLLIASHIRWKLKLRDAIDDKTKLDANLISRDDCCVLGKWLHGSDTYRQMNNLQSYRECVAKHADFHSEAGKLANLINAGEYDAAQQLLSNRKSNFNRASATVVSTIFRLEKETLDVAKKSDKQRAVIKSVENHWFSNFVYAELPAY